MVVKKRKYTQFCRQISKSKNILITKQKKSLANVKVLKLEI